MLELTDLAIFKLRDQVMLMLFFGV